MWDDNGYDYVSDLDDYLKKSPDTLDKKNHNTVEL